MCKHLQNRIAKVVAWTLSAILSVLIIASRKHYTVDIVVAWYVVPLVFLALERLYVTKRNDSDAISAKSIELQSVLVDAPGRCYSGDRGSDSSRLEGESDAEACVATSTSRDTAAQFAHGMPLRPLQHHLHAFVLRAAVARRRTATCCANSLSIVSSRAFKCTVCHILPRHLNMRQRCCADVPRCAGVVSPKGYRSGKHSRRPTNDGLHLQRDWDAAGLRSAALPQAARIQSKSKLGPLA